MKIGDYINSIDEANSAPKGTIIINGYGHAIQKGGDGNWHYDVNESEPLTAKHLFNGIPRLVVWIDGTGGVWFDDGWYDD